MDYAEFFETATGFWPYPFQCRVADVGFPDIITAPTGAGKTEAVVVPWLWRAFRGSAGTQAATPRRLIIALPMRTLVEQTERRVADMLERLGVADAVHVQVLMGGRLSRDDLSAWRTTPDERSIVIGTVDGVVSRALNRGYGATRGAYPIDFALLTNGAQIVVDEVQLCVQATATLRQISAFQSGWQTAEPAGLTCMSATILPEALDVVDNPYDEKTTSVIRLEADDETDPILRQRLAAAKTVEQLHGCDKPKVLAERIIDAHMPGSLTLVMVNTVKRAVETYRALKGKTQADLLLLHSHFRGVERADIVDRVLSEVPPEGRIVVATQTLEAGVDLDARTLVTEAAPWSSLVQRAGRLNRKGRQPDARLLWFEAMKDSPYDAHDTAATADALRAIEGRQVSGHVLLTTRVAQVPTDLAVIRRSEMEDLFETAADQAGRDIDISRYIRGDEPLDIQIAWVDTASYEGVGRSVTVPPEPLRCAAKAADVRSLLSRDPRPRVLMFSTTDDRWVRVTSGAQVKPQQLLLVDRADGGYDTEAGFSPSSRTPVAITEAEASARADDVPRPDTDGVGNEPGAQSSVWLPLATHLAETREQAETLIEEIARTVSLDPDMRAAVVGAAALHDIGKAHPIWQGALLATSPDHPTAGVFAKSPGSKGQLICKDENGRRRRNFRHELVSALMLMSPDGADAMTDAGVPEAAHDLCRYLVAAHHGIVRVSPQDPTVEGRSGRTLFGLLQADLIPTVTGGKSSVDLARVFGGGPGSWTDRSLALLDHWGPFRLAYAEMLVRMADWRASALPHPEVTP
ncbi:CRISPR-associated helicase/endonuclease Cas3 [Propionicicella superfundia]|uniref:CRISPR-associated helicase/endonuclease Cas3 n=1 Tax=Propionicicella superfundia TaxID=348582 RepID=UPI0003F5755D|nr:CRISPR-associated helicase/endonuclease Cas3 [Propionicicella superfundia]